MENIFYFYPANYHEYYSDKVQLSTPYMGFYFAMLYFGIRSSYNENL